MVLNFSIINDVIVPYTLSHLICTRPLQTNLARMQFEAIQFLLQFGKNEQGNGVEWHLFGL